MKRAIARLATRALTLPDSPETLDRIEGELLRTLHAVEAKRRGLLARSGFLPKILNARGDGRLGVAIREARPPWSGQDVGTCDVPGMLKPEEAGYYLYLGQFYSGAGEFVELGPWLGRSTHFIVRGLADNPNFRSRKLHVYDDFVWRHWMDPRAPEADRRERHADFRDVFDRYARPIADEIIVEKRRIVTFDGNDDVEQLAWSGKPVEIIVADCGRTFEVNEAWWQIFSPSFIPGRTLIALQDWGTHREVPVKWYNQIKTWVDSKGAELQLVHELRHGGIATFLYRGPVNDA